MKKENILKIIIVIICLIIVASLIYYFGFRKKNANIDKPDDPVVPVVNNNLTFDYKIIHACNTQKDNYMVSPLSMAYALNLLKEGSKNNTQKELNNLLDGYGNFPNTVSNNKIGIANAIFIKDKYKNDINNEYKNKLINNYHADVLYDEFVKPDVINNWVKEKTFNMIPNILNNMDKDFVLGLANAIAIDVEWKNLFDCGSTSKEEFIKYDNNKIDVSMMHSSENANYIKSNKAQGITKAYKMYNSKGEEVFEKANDTIELEFISILPNDDINEYINNFDQNELDILLNSKKDYKNNNVLLGIPKFEYDYSLDNFMDILKSLGVKDVFDEDNADLTNMLNKTHSEELNNLFVSEAIHKTKIEFNENGTKAAALTYFGVKNSGIAHETKTISITFNKPFLYIIKDVNSNNIWFFGVVYEPTLWTSETKNCSN